LVVVESATFAECVRVERIDLKINRLAKLPDGLLKNCRRLVKLDINTNLLASLPNSLIKPCTKLQSINMSRNQIKELNSDFFRLVFEFFMLGLFLKIKLLNLNAIHFYPANVNLIRAF